MCQLLIAHTHAVCPICEDLEPLSSMQTVEACDDAGDNPVCEFCLGNHYRKCESCAGYFGRYDCVSTDDGVFCQSCFDDEFVSCERCECTVRQDKTSSVNNGRNGDEQWCECCRDSHSFCCADCDEVFSDRLDSGRNARNETVCPSCAESYFYCDRCDETYHMDDYGVDGMCNNCHRDREDENSSESEHVHDYNYKPRPIFHGDDGDSLPGAVPGVVYAGVELETIVKSGNDYHEQAEKCVELLGDFAYMKEDGSLDGDGFEIVTHPATMEGHRKLWKKFHNDVPAIKSWSDSRCGLHVHITRAGMTDLQISKMVCFTNSEDNRAFIVKLAGRESSYAKLKLKKLGSACKPSDDRREAVNLCNSKTIEFRLFKGNIKAAWIFRSVQFCLAIAEYCKPASRSLADSLDYRKFCEWVNGEKLAYAELATFCSEYLDKN